MIVWRMSMLALAAGVAVCATSDAPASEVGCDVADLNAVFANPMNFRGKRFCGWAVGVPRDANILFYPPGYAYAGRERELVLYLDTRTHLRLVGQHSSPFSIYVQGIVEPAERCFAPGADRPRCIPYHYPIQLQVTRMGRVSENAGMGGPTGDQNLATVTNRPARSPEPRGTTSGPPARHVYAPSDLVQNIENVAGRRARVVGYLRVGQDARALWDSREAWQQAVAHRGQDSLWNRCVTFYYDLSLENEIDDLNGRLVELEAAIGINRANEEGVDFWACNEVYVNAYRIRPSQDPPGEASAMRRIDGPGVAVVSAAGPDTDPQLRGPHVTAVPGPEQ